MTPTSESAAPGLRSSAEHRDGQAAHSSGQAAHSSARALLFLALAIVGLIGQVALAGVFVADNGLDLGELGDQIFSSTIAALTFADLMMCALVFIAWFPGEAARVGMRRWWPFALALFGGLCFALPLFLYFRERRRIGVPTYAT